MPQSSTKFLDVAILQRMSRTAVGAVIAHRLVKIAAANHTKAAQVAAANDKVNGVAADDAADTKSFSISTAGRIAVVAGGTVAAGDEVVSDANGKAVVRGTTASVLYNVFGHAITSATLDELVMVQWGPYTVWGANAT